MRSPSTERFDPADVPLLLDKARAGDLEARNQLLYMFQRLVATLVNVCITGRVNYRSSYQKSFLRYFGQKDTPIENTAAKLRQRLADVDKKELFTVGQVAVLEAIRDCKTNLASTIVLRFKEQIDQLTTESVHPERSAQDAPMQAPPDMESEVIFKVFLDSLPGDQREVVEALLAGEEVEVPEELKKKVEEYFLSA